MTKATAGERFAAKWSSAPFSLRMASELDGLLARERRKVAEDVLAIAARTDISTDWLSTLATAVHAKYGKGKR